MNALPSLRMAFAFDLACEIDPGIVAIGAISTPVEVLESTLDLSIFPLCDNGKSFQHSLGSIVIEAIADDSSNFSPRACRDIFSHIVQECVAKKSASGGSAQVDGITYAISDYRLIADVRARDPAKAKPSAKPSKPAPPKPKVQPPKPSLPKPPLVSPTKSKIGKAETCQQKMSALAAVVG